MFNHNADALREALEVDMEEVDRILEELSKVIVENVVRMSNDLPTIVYVIYMMGYNHGFMAADRKGTQ